MTPEVVSDLMREALYLAMVMVSVIIVPSLVIGLIVSVFQAATQINEQTLSFLPRLIITLVTLIVLGPWLGGLVTDFTERLIVEIPTLLG
ncbi:MAG: flagellar biosynthesis protein FliQ [Gammaproteobacteria bacterium]|jgi:flagellar biosynthetic protein FliQ